MNNELIINSTQDGYRIALLKDGKLVEYHVENKNNKFTVGDVYLGTVKKLVPGLNAGFVDIGYTKDAFLHYLDLGSKFRSLNKFTEQVINKKHNTPSLNQFEIEAEIDKHGKISDLLSKGQKILVQVVKEPISTKGPRLSCEISLAGRHIVLVPFTDEVNISRQITSIAERKRLFRLVSSIKPKNFGVIVRTVSEGREVAELDKDLKALLQRWEEGIKTLKRGNPRDKIIGEINRASSLLRDMLNESFDSIIVDDAQLHTDIKQYIHDIAPEKENILKLYQEKTKIFERFGLEKQIKSLFGQIVGIEGGGYLVIEHTEALHVIDVNSGNRTAVSDDQESTALQVNLAAAKEIARQLRLRDMGGIIVVDFIDMKNPDHKRQVYQAIKDTLKNDRSKTNVLPLSKLGLLQMTRQRVRPELSIATKEQCSSCSGTGQVEASILVVDKIEKKLHSLFVNQNEQKVTLFVHPYVYAYFTSGFISKRLKWLFKYKRWVYLEQDTSLGITDYKFVNRKGEELDGE